MGLRTAPIAIVGTLALGGCLTVAPPGFVRSGQHAFYRGWFDVNTLDAPAVYFERVEELPYPDERVRSYPRAHCRTPGPRLAREAHQHVIAWPGALHPLGSPDGGEPPRIAPPTVWPAPVTSEPELLPPPPAP
ncbi:MAG TPA: hypothetical protein VML55_09170 [Planctomycetaceae bacterium]|nr:hypothetical protein [Planctomycetaceae bacterium]